MCLFFFSFCFTLQLAKRKPGSFILTLDDLRSYNSGQSSINDQDQNASSKMIAKRYKDKSGKLWTILTESTGLNSEN